MWTYVSFCFNLILLGYSLFTSRSILKARKQRLEQERKEFEEHKPKMVWWGLSWDYMQTLPKLPRAITACDHILIFPSGEEIQDTGYTSYNIICIEGGIHNPRTKEYSKPMNILGMAKNVDILNFSFSRDREQYSLNVNVEGCPFSATGTLNIFNLGQGNKLYVDFTGSTFVVSDKEIHEDRHKPQIQEQTVPMPEDLKVHLVEAWIRTPNGDVEISNDFPAVLPINSIFHHGKSSEANLPKQVATLNLETDKAMVVSHMYEVRDKYLICKMYLLPIYWHEGKYHPIDVHAMQEYEKKHKSNKGAKNS